MSKRFIIAFCGILFLGAPISIDIILPVLENINNELGFEIGITQLTVTGYLAAHGMAQIIFGPLSDYIGRKPTLIIGSVIGLYGSWLCFNATHIDALLYGRIITGIGSACALVVGRAILRDMFSGKELASALSASMMIFAASPLIIPYFGYGISSFYSATTIFIVVGIHHLIIILLCLFFFKETNHAHLAGTKLLHTLGAKTLIFFRNKQSFFYLSLHIWTVTSLQIILANLPHLYQKYFHIDGLFFCFVFTFIGATTIVGHIINRRLLKTLSLDSMGFLSAACLALVALLMLINTYSLYFFWWTFTVLLALYATIFWVFTSNITSKIIDPHPTFAGYASALTGTCVGLGAGVLSTILLQRIEGAARLFVVFVFIIAMLNLLAMLFAHQRKIKQAKLAQPTLGS